MNGARLGQAVASGQFKQIRRTTPRVKHVQGGPQPPSEHDAAVRGHGQRRLWFSDRAAIDGDQERLVAPEYRRDLRLARQYPFEVGPKGYAFIRAYHIGRPCQCVTEYEQFDFVHRPPPLD
jgi:hypothetical protein